MDSTDVLESDNYTSFPPIQIKIDIVMDEPRMMYISDETVHIVTLVNIVIIGLVLSLFGIGTNIINILVFARQGFQETINISLCALAISDLMSLATLVWIAICYNPLFTNADLSFLSLEVEIVTGGIPHVIAINATGWMTAFITLERCICIAFPLKVKDIITPGRTKVIVVLIFLLAIAGQIPTFYTTRLGWKFVPSRNKTLFGVIFLQDADVINGITYYTANVLGPVATFTIVSICTGVLIVKLTQKSRWRQSAAKTKDDGFSSTRDQRIVKMVVVVAVIFVVSFTPTVIIFILMVKETEFKIAGRYHNNFMVTLDCALLIEAMNGSVNIFIYYTMSSKYRLVFRSIFFGEKMIA